MYIFNFSMEDWPEKKLLKYIQMYKLQAKKLESVTCKPTSYLDQEPSLNCAVWFRSSLML